MTKPITRADKVSWFNAIWNALHSHRENCIPEGIDNNDEEWDEITTAMAWVMEELGVDYSGLED